MTSRSGFAGAVLWAALGLHADAASAVAITVIPGTTSYVRSEAAGTHPDGADFDSAFPAGLGVGSISSAEGGSAASSAFDLSNSAFSFSVDHTRAAVELAYAESQALIRFSSDSTVTYELSGGYASVDGAGRHVSLSAVLSDATTGTTLVRSLQDSRGVADEAFTLGLTEGSFFNVFEGSLTGTLIAGQEYFLSFQAYVHAELPTALAASGSGSITLSFVPEPDAATLLWLAAISLPVWTVRRRSGAGSRPSVGGSVRSFTA